MIEEKGWKLIRIKGIHHVFGKEGEKIRLVVPVQVIVPSKPVY